MQACSTCRTMCIPKTCVSRPSAWQELHFESKLSGSKWKKLGDDDHTTTTTPRHYNYNYSCTTPHYIQQLWVRWPVQPWQPVQKKTQLQPPYGPSVDSLCRPWITTTNLSYKVPILKLPPPPCAVLLVLYIWINVLVYEGLMDGWSCWMDGRMDGWMDA